MSDVDATAPSPKRTFVVEHGACKGEYGRILLSTDLEPDDVLAIKLLAPRLRGMPLLVVLGEGDVDKTKLCANMLAYYGLDGSEAQSTLIIQGQLSKRKYPQSLLTAFPDNAGNCKILQQPPSTDLNIHLKMEIEAFLRHGDTSHGPFALLLKPPHEIQHIDAELLQRTGCAIYGSFNVDEYLAVAGPQGGSQLAEILNNFKSCLLAARSSSIGRDETVNVTQREIWRYLDNDDGLKQAMKAWNGELVPSLHSSVEKMMQSAEANEEKIAKRKMVIALIEEHGGLQTPLADPLVVAALTFDEVTAQKFEKRGRFLHEGNALLVQPNNSMTHAELCAQAGEERAALVDATKRAIEALLQTGSGDVAPFPTTCRCF